MIVFGIMLSLLAGRLVQLQVLDTQGYALHAEQQATKSRALPALRGTITDRSGVVLAQSEPAVTVTCDPTQIEPADRLTVAQILAAHLGGVSAQYLPVLSAPGTRYAVVKKQVPAATFTKISDELFDLGLAGVYREIAPVRSYPSGTTASNVVGFVDAGGTGLGGLEYSLNAQLAGKAGSEAYETSAYGRMPLGAQQETPPVNGINYQLTLDADFQAQSELALSQAVERSKAKTGTAIVMNVKTGEVLAMANTPGFDANNFGAAASEDLGNRAVSDAYEPGSVQKVLTFAALADAGLLDPETHVVVPEKLRSGDADITDEHLPPSQHMTARGVLGVSSNVGTAILSRQFTREQYVNYMRQFGLGAKTGIELPGEGTGSIDAEMTDPVRDRAAFGQAISVTAIQEAAALAGIANHGIYNPPTILKSATDPNGKAVALPRRAPRRIISEKASEQVIDMMENVVTVASSGTFVVNGYRTFGKTGTAERIDPDCGCYRSNTVSYVGIGPVEDPSILVYVVVDQPSAGAPSGATQAEPTAHDLLTVALPRYGMAFSTTPARKEAFTW